MKFFEKISSALSKVIKTVYSVSEYSNNIPIENEKIKDFINKNLNPRMSGPVKDIIEILNTYNITYELEKIFPECKNQRALPFDFCIYTKRGFFLIEYDGIQHYKPSFGLNEEQRLENFNHTKQNDSIKDQYCQENNIRLYRIGYNENHIEKIIVILKKHKMI